MGVCMACEILLAVRWGFLMPALMYAYLIIVLLAVYAKSVLILGPSTDRSPHVGKAPMSDAERILPTMIKKSTSMVYQFILERNRGTAKPPRSKAESQQRATIS